MGFGKDKKGVILREENSITLGTLGTDTGILMTGGIGATLAEDFRMIKLLFTFWLDGGTFVAGDGPLSLWIANGDLSLAEIEEAIEVEGPLDRSDRIRTEQAERYVTQLGVITFVEGSVGMQMYPRNGDVGEAIIRWTFSNAKGWTFVVYNEGTALTTGGVVHMRGKAFGVWLL